MGCKALSATCPCSLTNPRGRRSRPSSPRLLVWLRGARFENLIRDFEHSLRGPFRDRVARAPPRLDVAAAVLDTRQIKRGAAQERDCFGLTLAEAARGLLAVGLLAFRGVTEPHVRQFVKRRLVRHR